MSRMNSTLNRECKMELRKRQMSWYCDMGSIPINSNKERNEECATDSDDSDTFNPNTSLKWKPNSKLRRSTTSFLQQTIRIEDTKDKTLRVNPALLSSDDTTLQLCNNDNVDAISLLPNRRTDVDCGHNVDMGDDEDEKETSPMSSITLGDSEDYSNGTNDSDDAVYMFEGGPKRNIRDKAAIIRDASPESSGDLDKNQNETNIDFYKPRRPVGMKILIDSNVGEIADFTNYTNSNRHVYFDPEEISVDFLGKFSANNVTWNVEYPGCSISRCKTNDTVCGFIKIKPRTIRPFGRVETKQPMHMFVLNGEVVLKTTVVCTAKTVDGDLLALDRVNFKSGDIIILPCGNPFSLENHTANTVDLGYSFFDAK